MGEQEIGKCNNNGNMMSNFYKESGCQYECTIFMHRDSCIHKTSNSLDSHTKTYLTMSEILKADECWTLPL